MLPVQRLNALSASLDLGESGGHAQVLNWNYASHLPDNLPHRHTFFEICTIGTYGEGEFFVEKGSHPIRRGDTFFARPGVIHQIVNTAAPHMELFWVSFSLEGSGDLARAFAKSDVLVAQDERIGAIWTGLATAATSTTAGSSEVVRSLSCALLQAILGAGSDLPASATLPSPDFHAHQARLAVRFVHDNLARPLSLNEIAAHVHVSSRQLTRLFAQFTGTSPAAYIERARMDRAEALLLKSSLSLKAIAHEVGYADAAHFSRVFSKRSGNPPGDFRRRGGPIVERPSGSNIQRLGDLV
ncbi:HTH-type transcriptional activator Btr [Abditibacteriota bacterium]|nr:HTH-type transcriptional activator Btr [Abditibacteriota bacterium]